MRVSHRKANNISSVLVYFAFFLFIFASCSQEDTAPQGTLAPDKMALILTDIHVAESRITKLQLKSMDSSILVFDKLKSEIWKKHKVDTLLYNKSYSYYISRPKQMKQIYEKVNKNLEKREKTNNIKL